MLALAGCGPQESRYVIEIRQPPAKVWPWVTEPDKLEQWIGGVKEIKPLTDDKVLRVGAREQMILEMPEGRYVMESEVLAFETARMIRVKAVVPDGFDQIIEYTLDDTGGATRLTFSSQTTLKHWVANLLLPLWWPDAEKKLNSDLARLKALAEAS